MAETVIPEISVLHCPNCDSDLWVVAHRILTAKGHIAVESSESRAHSCLYCSYTYEQRLPQNDDGWQGQGPTSRTGKLRKGDVMTFSSTYEVNPVPPEDDEA